MALHEIIYVSLASEDMTLQQLQALLTYCRGQNEKSAITGMLIYHQREFLQLLEGEAEVVTALFERITVDQRHQQVYKLWDGPISERSCARWSMALIDQALIDTTPQAEPPSWFHQGLARSVKDSTGKKLLLRLRDEFLQRHGEST